MTDGRDRNRWRRAGYRLLPGELFSYVLFLRPAEWPIMAAHTALGWVLAVGWHGVERGTTLGPAAGALAIWVVCLNGGTLALNSAFDKDEGDVGYLVAPPSLPRHLLGFSVGLLFIGQVLSWGLPVLVRLDYAFCCLLSILYSVPPARLKARAGMDWLINMWGFGTLTPLASWAATGRPLTAEPVLVLLGFCPLFAGLYPLTQLYQADEDRRRGDRTLALALGVESSLVVAIGATVAAFALFAAAGVLGHRGLWTAALALPAVAWALVLVPWWHGGARWSAARHENGMYRALAAWALTDLAVLVVFAR